jgi:hypothetical protein
MNKKGAEMTIGTIIVIILALVVLVVIIYGFTVGWGNLWQRLTGFSPKANIQTHIQACQLACTTESVSDYCKDRDVYLVDNQKEAIKMKCPDIVLRNVGLERCPSITSCVGVGETLPGLECNSWGGGDYASSCDKTKGEVEVPKILLLDSEENSEENINKVCCTIPQECTQFQGGEWVKARACGTNQYNVNALVKADLVPSGYSLNTDNCCVNLI